MKVSIEFEDGVAEQYRHIFHTSNFVTQVVSAFAPHHITEMKRATDAYAQTARLSEITAPTLWD